MKNGLLERIRSVGHWRVNIRPSSATLGPLSNNDAYRLVQNNRVSMRGWDYPFVIDRNDDTIGRENHQGFVENWCDWTYHLEFWRMYASSQFIHYKVLWEDIERGDGQPVGPVLSVTSAIYTVSEICEFSNRLVQSGAFGDGAILHLSLRNVDGRKLWVNEFNRMGFSYDRVAHGQEIALESTLSSTSDSRKMAVDHLLSLFSVFGWEVSKAQMEKEVEAYHEGQMR